MFGSRITLGRKSKDEAEKPFWISYADLMTALMMLFLVVMCVALMSMITAQEGPDKERAEDIRKIYDYIRADIKRRGIQGVEIDEANHLIKFGDKARFEFGKYDVSPDSSVYLRTFIPVILDNIDRKEFQRWFRRVIVEGYTSQEGTYLFNLNLSLQRAEKVICTLLSPPIQGEVPLTDEQKKLIRRIFMVGGFSANSTKGNPLEDRRVEFRLHFWTVQEDQLRANLRQNNINPGFEAMELGKCGL